MAFGLSADVLKMTPETWCCEQRRKRNEASYFAVVSVCGLFGVIWASPGGQPAPGHGRRACFHAARLGRGFVPARRGHPFDHHDSNTSDHGYKHYNQRGDGRGKDVVQTQQGRVRRLRAGGHRRERREYLRDRFRLCLWEV